LEQLLELGGAIAPIAPPPGYAPANNVHWYRYIDRFTSAHRCSSFLAIATAKEVTVSKPLHFQTRQST